MIPITSVNTNTALNYCINKYINRNPRFCFGDDGGKIMSKNDFNEIFNGMKHWPNNTLCKRIIQTQDQMADNRLLCSENYIPTVVTIPNTDKGDRLYCKKNDNNNTPFIDGCRITAKSILGDLGAIGAPVATHAQLLSINKSVVDCAKVKGLCTKKDVLKCRIPDFKDKVCDSSPETCPRKCGLCNVPAGDDYDIGKFYFHKKPHPEINWRFGGSYEDFIHNSKPCDHRGSEGWERTYPCTATKEECIKDTQMLWKHINLSNPNTPVFFNWFNDIELSQDIGICEKFNSWHGYDREHRWGEDPEVGDRDLFYNTLIDSKKPTGSNYMIITKDGKAGEKRDVRGGEKMELIIPKLHDLVDPTYANSKTQFWRGTKKNTTIVSGMINTTTLKDESSSPNPSDKALYNSVPYPPPTTTPFATWNPHTRTTATTTSPFPPQTLTPTSSPSSLSTSPFATTPPTTTTMKRTTKTPTAKTYTYEYGTKQCTGYRKLTRTECDRIADVTDHVLYLSINAAPEGCIKNKVLGTVSWNAFVPDRPAEISHPNFAPVCKKSKFPSTMPPTTTKKRTTTTTPRPADAPWCDRESDNDTDRNCYMDQANCTFAWLKERCPIMCKTCAPGYTPPPTTTKKRTTTTKPPPTTTTPIPTTTYKDQESDRLGITWDAQGYGKCIDEDLLTLPSVFGLLKSTGNNGMERCKAECANRWPLCQAFNFNSSSTTTGRCYLWGKGQTTGNRGLYGPRSAWSELGFTAEGEDGSANVGITGISRDKTMAAETSNVLGWPSDWDYRYDPGYPGPPGQDWESDVVCYRGRYKWELEGLRTTRKGDGLCVSHQVNLRPDHGRGARSGPTTITSFMTNITAASWPTDLDVKTKCKTLCYNLRRGRMGGQAHEGCIAFSYHPNGRCYVFGKNLKSADMPAPFSKHTDHPLSSDYNITAGGSEGEDGPGFSCHVFEGRKRIEAGVILEDKTKPLVGHLDGLSAGNRRGGWGIVLNTPKQNKGIPEEEAGRGWKVLMDPGLHGYVAKDGATADWISESDAVMIYDDADTRNLTFTQHPKFTRDRLEGVVTEDGKTHGPPPGCYVQFTSDCLKQQCNKEHGCQNWGERVGGPSMWGEKSKNHSAWYRDIHDSMDTLGAEDYFMQVGCGTENEIGHRKFMFSDHCRIDGGPIVNIKQIKEGESLDDKN